jgi:hypothetical protein
MYEDGIDVVYELRRDRDVFGPHGRLHMPGWCAGDPQMAVALHFFGSRDAADDVRITDWTPTEDADEEPFPSDRELARR